MKKFISTQVAIEHCNDNECIIPSAFLSVFPNNFGINLCAVKGFEIEVQEDGQIKSINTIFIPTDEPLQFDHSWTLQALKTQGI